MTTESQTVRRAKQGDKSAFGELVERFQGPVYRFNANMVGDRHAAEDLSQEAFVAAYANLARFDPDRGSFSTWLFTIAKRRCLNWLAKKKPRVLEDGVPDSEADKNADPVAREEFMATLDQALARLTPELRSTFVLREISGLSHRDIAAIENVDEGTVRSRLSRAKAALRQALKTYAGGLT